MQWQSLKYLILLCDTWAMNKIYYRIYVQEFNQFLGVFFVHLLFQISQRDLGSSVFPYIHLVWPTAAGMPSPAHSPAFVAGSCA